MNYLHSINQVFYLLVTTCSVSKENIPNQSKIEWNIKNSEKLKEMKKIYRLNNIEEVKKYQITYRLENLEKNKAYKKEYYQRKKLEKNNAIQIHQGLSIPKIPS
jgi:hypothetical protein